MGQILKLPSKRVVSDKYLKFLKNVSGNYFDDKNKCMTRLLGTLYPVAYSYFNPPNDEDGKIYPMCLVLTPYGGPDIVKGGLLAGHTKYVVEDIHYQDNNWYIELLKLEGEDNEILSDTPEGDIL